MSLENLLAPGTAPSSSPNQETTQQAPQTAQVEPKPEVKKDEDRPSFAKQFSALSRREREIRQREQQIEEREKAVQSGSDKYQEYVRKLKMNPVEALKEAGVSLDYLTNVQLSDGEIPQDVKISTEVEDLKAMINALQAKLEGKDKQPDLSPEEQAEEQFKQGMFEHLEANNEKYKLIAKHEAADVVWHTIDELFQQSVAQGKARIPSYDEAAELVENYLREEARKVAEELGYIPKSESTDQGSKQVSNSGSQSSPTLSNQLSTTRPTEASPRLLSRDEAIRRAAELLRHK
jgi:hypothetical protein